jgi:hypothetical protein
MFKSLHSFYLEHEDKISHKYFSYFEIYDRAFAPFRTSKVRLLEIGIQNGGSLEIWSKYFPEHSILIGCDIDENCKKLHYEINSIKVVVGDILSEEIQMTLASHASQFDIIIDDGSHASGDIIQAFARFFPKLADGGLFVVEDLHCSHWEHWKGGINDPLSSMSFLKRLADFVNSEHWCKSVDHVRNLIHPFIQNPTSELLLALTQIYAVNFYNSICIIEKRPVGQNSLFEHVIAGSDALVNQQVKRVSGQKPSPKSAPKDLLGSTWPSNEIKVHIFNKLVSPIWKLFVNKQL